MKPLLALAGAVLLSGCAHQPQAAVQPEGVFKLVETDDLITYFSAKSVTLYDNNPHLRQFYLINNYKAPAFIEELKQTISSSRATRVINCERDEVTDIERVYFSEPFALGAEVTKKAEKAQWRAFPRQSVIGDLRGLVCGVDGGVLGAPAVKK